MNKLLEKSANMFELMEISESIYEVVVKPSYKTYYGRFQPCWSYEENEMGICLINYLLRHE